jgi:hypothetical protein
LNFEPRTIAQIISVQSSTGAIFLVKTVYPETDALNATGQVLRAEWNSDRSSLDPDKERGVCLLNTNDSLAGSWCSPRGNLWVSTARGNIWTTAKVAWPTQRWRHLKYEVPDKKLGWFVTTLPNAEKTNHPPNVTAIWGTDDNDVFAATFMGALYHWDGKSWQQVHPSEGAALHHIHGTGDSDIYCVGDRGIVLYFDGKSWRRIPYPDEDDDITGIRAVAPGEVFLCTSSGKIARGGPQGLEILGEYPAPFYGIARFKQRLILAGGGTGVWELKKNRASVLKDSVYPAGLFEAGNVLFFVEASQEPAPAILQYNPKIEDPWLEWDF